jgi:acyl-CoA synthetase (AMP-forming)/AMP-acid ligase II
VHITHFFDRGARLAPDRACLVTDDRTLTYREVDSAAWRVANALRTRGVQRGDAVAIVSNNSVEVVLAILGTLRAGARWVAINSRNAHDEIANLVDLTEARALLHATGLDLDVPGLAGDIDPGLVLPIDGPNGIETWSASASAEPAPLEFDEDDVALLIGTGGTTGRSKAVQLTHRNLSTMVANYLWAMPAYADAVNLVAAPITHGAGLMTWPQFAMGATNIVHPGVDAAAILSGIEKHRVTHLFLPPTAIYSLLTSEHLGEHDYGSLRYFMYGAAPMSADKLRTALEVFGPVMTQTYGQVECPVTLSFLLPADHVRAMAEDPELLLSAGKAPLLTNLAVVDESGAPVGVGETGEIAVRGDLVTPGYLKDPDATAEARIGPWHLTGDVGRVDERGYLFISDRKKDMIISGGFNLFPSEIEQVIWGIEGVQDCAVIGIPDPKWGEACTAVVELDPGASVTEDEICAVCRSVLGSMKTPKSVVFVPSLPRSPVGKVLKRELRLTFWADQARLV